MTKTLLTTLLLSISLMTQAENPDIKTSNEQFNDWTLTCTEVKDNKTCQATQGIANQQGQLVSKLNIIKSADDKDVIEIALPLMLDLTVPVAIQVDDNETENYPYRLCNNQACFVLISGESLLMKQMKKGNKMVVQVQPATQPGALRLEFSLKGLTRVVKALNRE